MKTKSEGERGITSVDLLKNERAEREKRKGGIEGRK